MAGVVGRGGGENASRVVRGEEGYGDDLERAQGYAGAEKLPVLLVVKCCLLIDTCSVWLSSWLWLCL